jgi:hypothetical protein
MSSWQMSLIVVLSEITATLNDSSQAPLARPFANVGKGYFPWVSIPDQINHRADYIIYASVEAGNQRPTRPPFRNDAPEYLL